MIGAPDIGSSLAFLLGRFGGTEDMSPSAWTAGGRADATARGSLYVGDNVVVQHQTQSDGSAERFASLNVFCVDPKTSEILLYSFDSTGQLPEPPARGAVSAGTLTLDRATPRGESRTTYRAVEGGFGWEKLFRPGEGEEWELVVSGRLHAES